MSFNTLADEKLDACRDAVESAIEALGAVAVERASGTDEYSMAARNQMREALNLLLETRIKLEFRT